MKTALVAIGRRENQYAREWVGHHLALGFDHIYIYDNNHEGEEHFETVLSDYVADGSVTVIWDYRDLEGVQRHAYNDAYKQLSKDYDWIAFFDFDEFLFLPDGKPAGVVAEAQGTVAVFLASLPRMADCAPINSQC